MLVMEEGEAAVRRKMELYSPRVRSAEPASVVMGDEVKPRSTNGCHATLS